MEHKHLGKADTAFMAACTGLIVANIYYCQPLIVLIAKEWGLKESAAGRVTYLTQIGYALGLLLLVPLGDILERKKQILATTLVAIGALLLAATAQNFIVLQAASLLIGISSVVPQLILPLAAHLAPDHKRGSIIGMIMGGLLIGILASRSVSGSVGALWGWREMYYIAAGICAVLLVLMYFRFPESQPTLKSNYGELMRTVAHYARTHPRLREASVMNALSFAVLSAFWVTMVLFLSNAPFKYSSAQIGLFGIAGAAGALAAPLVGKMSDGRDPRRNIIIGLVLELLSFGAFYFTGSNIILLLVGIVLVDVGHQSIMVTNQTIIYALKPEARNRFNTVYMTTTFIGGAAGSAIGLWFWNHGQWPVVCAGCTVIILINIALFYMFRPATAKKALI
ncbi:MFS transporter [Chitinophaga sp.]|uniref:MFS transporter n=1 Tax=Chitinophaga sp. TaxID=1869181 RepID=UPI0031D5F24A